MLLTSINIAHSLNLSKASCLINYSWIEVELTITGPKPIYEADIASSDTDKGRSSHIWDYTRPLDRAGLELVQCWIKPGAPQVKYELNYQSDILRGSI
jgi:hypothetical protein